MFELDSHANALAAKIQFRVLMGVVVLFVAAYGIDFFIHPIPAAIASLALLALALMNFNAKFLMGRFFDKAWRSAIPKRIFILIVTAACVICVEVLLLYPVLAELQSYEDLLFPAAISTAFYLYIDACSRTYEQYKTNNE
ncbi:MAG: Protein of unknown function (DUF2721) [Idiomarinaceae bacterium HL-53]|nr:MAG: Protein of unknown function (DUF2721) [Idiomarinaceae bacterium HL-53]CUS47673.1 hypothetical protein Ga0003345_0606 [Idiomarinaceae bacterium HL-53]